MNLPEEVIIHILSFLAHKDLRQCMEVSKKMRHLILTSTILMRKINISFSDKNDTPNVMKFIKKYGVYVKHLKLWHFDYFKDVQLTKFLKSMPNLETIYCHEFHSPGLNYNEPSEEIIFEELTYARFATGEKVMQFLLKCIEKSSKLEFLEISINKSIELGDDFMKNLMEKGKLKILNTREAKIVGDGLKAINHNNFKLRLSELTCKLNGSQNCNEFLKSQADCVKIFTVLCSENFSCFKTIIEEFKAIEKFQIQIPQELGIKISINLQHCRLPSVKDFTVYGNKMKIETLQTIMKWVPNVENLKVNLSVDGPFKYSDAITNLPYLERIEFGEVKPDSIHDLEIPSLKFLVIDSEYFAVKVESCGYYVWQTLFENCPNIEYIQIIIPPNRKYYNRYDDSFKSMIEELLHETEKLMNFKKFVFKNEAGSYDLEYDAVANTKIIKTYAYADVQELSWEYTKYQIVQIRKSVFEDDY